jgi:polyhydroxyalkanoate synthesis regulator protein
MRALLKYTNRKIYDLSEHRYITLAQIGDLIAHGETIAVTEKATGASITSEVLAGVILAQEQERPRFGAPTLCEVIRAAHAPEGA